MLLLGTMLTDGGGRVPRPLRWLGNVLRHPIQFLRVTKPWGKAESSTVLLVMQTVDNHTRLVRRRQPLWPFTRALTSQPEPGQPGIPSYIPIANEVAREFAAELDAIPQSTLNEVLLDTSTTAHILGGCAIASGPDRGVVDAGGQVHRSSRPVRHGRLDDRCQPRRQPVAHDHGPRRARLQPDTCTRGLSRIAEPGGS